LVKQFFRRRLKWGKMFMKIILNLTWLLKFIMYFFVAGNKTLSAMGKFSTEELFVVYISW
jgi:hypothetical protein